MSLGITSIILNPGIRFPGKVMAPNRPGYMVDADPTKRPTKSRCCGEPYCWDIFHSDFFYCSKCGVFLGCGNARNQQFPVERISP